MVELAVVVLVVALLAVLAAPQLRRALVKARAADAVAELQVLRVAVLSYLADNNQWPPDDGVGEIPVGLDSYLPAGYSFQKDGYELNYDNWSSHNPRFIAVTVEMTDAEFGAAILDLLGPNAWTNGTFKFTWVIEWLD